MVAHPPLKHFAPPRFGWFLLAPANPHVAVIPSVRADLSLIPAYYGSCLRAERLTIKGAVQRPRLFFLSLPRIRFPAALRNHRRLNSNARPHASSARRH
jgi:hypothetical protein